MASKTTHSCMPQDMIIEIFLKLPVKPLIRLRCVSKYWFTLLSSSSFVYKHYHHHNNLDNLFVQHHDYSTEKYTFALFTNEAVVNSSVEYHNLGNLQMSTQASIVGIFHGIIYLADYDRIVLWNPTIRELRVLHKPKPVLEWDDEIHNEFSGFGMDPTTSNYKVIWIWEYGFTNSDFQLEKRVAVYNLDGDFWNVIEVDLLVLPPKDVHESSSNNYLNGFYYWIADYHEVITLVAFDMDKEVFRHIPGPPLPEYFIADIVLHNNRITLFHWDLGNAVDRFLDIWVMVEEGFWIKEITVPPLLDFGRPLGFWINGEVFLESNTSELVLYNRETNQMNGFRVRGKYSALTTSIHKESLVSIKRVDEYMQDNNVFNLFRIEDFVLSGL